MSWVLEDVSMVKIVNYSIIRIEKMVSLQKSDTSEVNYLVYIDQALKVFNNYEEEINYQEPNCVQLDPNYSIRNWGRRFLSVNNL